MLFQQHEDSQRLVEIEKRLTSLEDKLDLKSLSESLHSTLQSSFDDWLSSSLTVSCIKEEMDRRYKRSRAELSEFTRDFKKSEKDMKDLQEKYSTLEEELTKIKSFISDMMIDLKLKAYNGDLNRVERILDTKCSNGTANELVEKIRNCAKSDEMVAVQGFMKDLEKRIEEEFFKKQEAFDQLEKSREKLLETLDMYSTREQTNGVSQKFYQKTVKIDTEIAENQKKIGILYDMIDKGFKNLGCELGDRVSFKDLNNLAQEVATKATKVDFTRYMADINPKISGFQNELGVFNRIIREQEQAMLRLDEVLLSKASKTETHDLYQKLSLISKHSDIEYKIDDMLNRQAKVQEDFNDIQSDMRQMQSQFSEMQTFFSKKSSDAMELKFLKDLILDMQTSISYKADRTETLNCLEQKAGWGDYNHLSQSLESVHRQIKLLAVQVGALEKLTTPTGKVRNAEKTQREYFNKITNRLVNYVVTSKPTVDDPPMPEEIKAFMKVPITPKTVEIKTRVNTPHRRTHYSFDQLNNV